MMKLVEYGKVNDAFVKDLRRIVGERAVIYEDREALESYSRDESGEEYYFHMPDVVVKPEKAEEISKIVKLCDKNCIPVTPRGAGSGLAGGAIPIFGGVVISLERMNRMLEIDRENMVAVVEPGVVTNELCRKVAEEGLYYAGYPMSVETSFIGGNVATNAGGSKVIKYGNTGHHVLGLEVVLPNGDVIEFGGKRRKDSSGYGMTRLFVGSEGTLGIFTKIYLNLIPLPGRTVDLLVPFKSIDKAIENVPMVMSKSRVIPTAVELVDDISVDFGSKYVKTRLPFQDEAKAYLIIQFEGRSLEELEDIYEQGGKLLIENGAIDVFIADNRSNSEKIWRLRRNWLEALKYFDPFVLTGDVVVPTSKIPEMMEEIRKISKEYHVSIPIAGHVADGNLHPAVMKPDGVGKNEWRELSEKVLDEIALKAGRLGGAVSGEHGIGFLKKKVLSETKKKQIEVMRKIKKVLDPNWIMNPGKVFDPE